MHKSTFIGIDSARFCKSTFTNQDKGEMMKRLWKSWGKSTFMVMAVVAMNSVAMAQFGSRRKADDLSMPKGIDKIVNTDSGIKLTRGTINPQDNLYEALKSQNVETTLTGEQLTSDWHIISSGEMGILAMLGPGRMMPQVAGFTQGRITSFGNEKYLVAYYVQVQDGMRDMYSYNNNRSRNGYLFKDSKLSLALLPLNGSQSIYEVKKFDPEKDYISKPVVNRATIQSNLKQIALATFMYAQDYDQKLPPMVAARNVDEIKNHYLPNANTKSGQILTANITATTTVQSRLLPYVKNKKIFLQPVTQRPYLPNYKISRHSLAAIKNPSTTFLFYEDAPDADGMRNVAYVDSHVAAISETEFQRQRKAQGISESGYPSAAKPVQKAKVVPKP